MKQLLLLFTTVLFAVPALGQPLPSTGQLPSYPESHPIHCDPGIRSTLHPGFPPPTAREAHFTFSEAHATASKTHADPKAMLPKDHRPLAHVRCTRMCFLRPSIFSPARKYREEIPLKSNPLDQPAAVGLKKNREPNPGRVRLHSFQNGN